MSGQHTQAFIGEFRGSSLQVRWFGHTVNTLPAPPDVTRENIRHFRYTLPTWSLSLANDLQSSILCAEKALEESELCKVLIGK